MKVFSLVQKSKCISFLSRLRINVENIIDLGLFDLWLWCHWFNWFGRLNEFEGDFLKKALWVWYYLLLFGCSSLKFPFDWFESLRQLSLICCQVQYFDVRFKVLFVFRDGEDQMFNGVGNPQLNLPVFFIMECNQQHAPNHLFLEILCSGTKVFKYEITLF